MKLLTWNLNHRARARAIPPTVVEALASLSPEVVVLTEYVPGPSHEEFTDALRSRGFSHLIMSTYARAENHVLIAARDPIERGDIEGPPIAPSVPSNVLHVRLVEHDLHVLGLRVPDYSKEPAVRHACWDWIEAVAAVPESKPLVILGDFNVDPNYPPRQCGDRLAKIAARGWQHALPTGGVSYWPVAGGAGKRLDHAFVSPHFSVTSAEYVWQSGQHVLGNRRSIGAMSDHAALLVEVERAEGKG